MPEPESATRSQQTLPRVLGPVTAFCVVVGSVIGSGIFLVPATVAHNIPYIGWIVIAWIIGGLLSLAGALTVAELGAMMPRAGGPYVYLREAYGPLAAFLFGWVEVLLARSGSMATLAAAFSRYSSQVIPTPGGLRHEVWQAFVAISAIAIVVTVNVLGTRRGGALQVVGTIIKVGGVSIIILLPFLLGHGSTANYAPVWPSQVGTSLWSGMMVAMVGILWAYDGWMNVTPIAEEIRDPERNVPRALIWGMGLIIALYLGATLAYHYVLPMTDVASASQSSTGFSKAVAAVYCQHLLGNAGIFGISVLVMVSTFISLNGNALTGPRAYFAMSRDKIFPDAFARIHPRFGTPSEAIIVQGIWAIVLVAVGTTFIALPVPEVSVSVPGPLRSAWAALHAQPLYDILFTYVVFGENVFYLIAILSVFTLRSRRPDLPRPYRTWGYPWTPGLYTIGATVLLISMLLDEATRAPSIAGLGIIASGIPAYWYFQRRAAVALPD